MKFTSILLVLSASAYVSGSAIPLPAAEAVAVTETLPEPWSGPDAFADAAIEERALNRVQCRAACKGGAATMEKFCRLVPLIPVRALCWGVATGVQTSAGLKACTVFCDAMF